jgi:hypothetical protein
VAVVVAVVAVFVHVVVGRGGGGGGGVGRVVRSKIINDKRHSELNREGKKGKEMNN